MFKSFLLLLLHGITGYSMDPIFLTGATSSLGQKVVKKITENDLDVVCLVRDSKKAMQLFDRNKHVHLFEGDVLDKNSIDIAMSNCSLSLNLHGIRKKSNLFNFWKINDVHDPYYVNFVGMDNIANLAKKKNMPIVRLTGLLCGLNNLHPLSMIFNILFKNNVYWHRESEKLLKDSGVHFTILRPGGIKHIANQQKIESTLVKQSPTSSFTDDIIKPPGFVDEDALANEIISIIMNIHINNDFENQIVYFKERTRIAPEQQNEPDEPHTPI